MYIYYMKKICKKHGLTEFYATSNSYRCKKCNVNSVTERRRKLKILAVQHKGGKCERCGYDKCIDALEFHHKDRSKKEFGIGAGSTKSWDKIKKEIEKCELLCSNCHKEEHSKIPL